MKTGKLLTASLTLLISVGIAVSAPLAVLAEEETEETDTIDLDISTYMEEWRNGGISAYSTDESRTIVSDLQNGYLTIGSYNLFSGKFNTYLQYGTDFAFDHYAKYDESSQQSVTVDEKTVFSTPGSYYAVMKGLGSYSEELNRTIDFDVYEPNDLESYAWKASLNNGDTYYTGTGKTFKIDMLTGNITFTETVVGGEDKTVSLVYGKDYELLRYDQCEPYKANIDEKTVFSTSGDYEAILVGKGEYSGSIGVKFHVAEGSSTGSSSHISGMSAGEYEEMMNASSSTTTSSSASAVPSSDASPSVYQPVDTSVPVSDSLNTVSYVLIITGACIVMIGFVLYRRKTVK